MRYIADANGYVKEVSFGAIIACSSDSCTEYIGNVPSGYSSLIDWFTREGETLHRWKIVANNLTLDPSAPEPMTEWENPPLYSGEEYRTTERYKGKPVYMKMFAVGALPNASYKDIQYHASTDVRPISVYGQAGSGPAGMHMTIPAEGMGIYMCAVNYNSVRITTTTDASGSGAYVFVKYYMETD